jgi:hypothetical protein
MADTEHFEIPKPRETDNIDAEMRRLQAAWDIVDGILNTFLQAINGKAPTNHSHAIDQVTGLAAALAGKMSSSKTFSLAELTDVVGYTDAPQGYVPVKNADGKVAFLSAAAAIGNHQHATTDIVGLTDLIQSAVDSIVGGAPPDLNTLLEIANALAKRLRVDAAQTFTEAEKGLARANIDAGVMAGFRNKIINPEFHLWSRGISQNSGGYGSVDRFTLGLSGSACTISRQNHPLGQTDVPGNPRHFLRAAVTSVAGANNYVALVQPMEQVKTLQGLNATVTFWAKSDVAGKRLGIEFEQIFGPGGSAPVQGIASQYVTLSTVWQKFTLLVPIPPISGKVLGAHSDCLRFNFWFDAGSTFNARSGNVGQQTATIDISSLSVVAGDARNERDPTSPRDLQQEFLICQRYAQMVLCHGRTYSAGANAIYDWPISIHQMRTNPAAILYGGGSGSGVTSVSVASVTALGLRFEIVAANAGDCYWIDRQYLLDAEL